MPARTSTAGEIIHIGVGKAGNAIAHQFWRDLCEEHRITYGKPVLERSCTLPASLPQGESDHVCEISQNKPDLAGSTPGYDPVREQYLNVFFNEGNSRKMDRKRYVPRSIFMDLNMQDLESVTSNSLGSLYRPDNIIGNDKGSGNCYAKAFHTEGPGLVDRCLEVCRTEVEKCNCLQGVQFTHAISGGTGSGLMGLLLKDLHDYLDKNSKCIMQTFTLVPSPSIATALVEPYNAALALQDLLEHCDQCFFFDNMALSEICQKTLRQESATVTMQNNSIIARVMSDITSCLRFNGPLNADIREMNQNLVPFKDSHFLISSIAPLTAESSKKYRAPGDPLDLAQQMMSKDSVTVVCDPLNPGDPPNPGGPEGVLKARFLASWSCWRGKLATYQIDKVLFDIQKPYSRWDKFFPDWIPNKFAWNLCEVPHCSDPDGNSVVLVSNNTAVHEVFDRVSKNWDDMYEHKTNVHVFEQDGISQDDLRSSRNILSYISDQYCDWAKKEHQFFEDNGKIKDAACENAEQVEIAKELQELGEGVPHCG